MDVRERERERGRERESERETVGRRSHDVNEKKRKRENSHFVDLISSWEIKPANTYVVIHQWGLYLDGHI